MPSVTAAQMFEVDRIAIAETGPTLGQMMENAGRSLALEALERLGERWQDALVVVLAGSGANGRGGICGARYLANRGIDVRLCLANAHHLNELTAFQRTVFTHTEGEEVTKDQLLHLRPTAHH